MRSRRLAFPEPVGRQWRIPGVVPRERHAPAPDALLGREPRVGRVGCGVAADVEVLVNADHLPVRLRVGWPGVVVEERAPLLMQPADHGQPNRVKARSTTRWRVWLPKRGRVTAWVKRHGGHREGHKADAEPDAFATEVSGRLSRR